MNYTEITELAKSYSDRSDTETTDRLDDFLKMVESRMNRHLKTMDMITRTNVPTVTSQEFYDLPSGFDGLKEIKVVDAAGATQSMHPVSPEYLDGLQNSNATLANYYYAIIGNQIRIMPTIDTGSNIQVAYYARVPELTAVATTNWMSNIYPDCYLFGLMVEISSFLKDKDAKVLWDERFKEALGEIEFENNLNRWSGTPMQVRLG